MQGISSIPSSAARKTGAKKASNQCFSGQFPTHPNREIFAALQGIKSGDQGNFEIFALIGESRSRPLFWHLSPLPTNPIVPTDLERCRESEQGLRQMFEVAEADLGFEAG